MGKGQQGQYSSKGLLVLHSLSTGLVRSSFSLQPCQAIPGWFFGQRVQHQQGFSTGQSPHTWLIIIAVVQWCNRVGQFMLLSYNGLSSFLLPLLQHRLAWTAYHS
jgi:hypothetical protein